MSNYGSEPQTQPAGFLANLWKLLTEPAKEVESFEGRQQARMVAVMLLVLIPLALFTIFRTRLMGDPNVQPITFPSILAIVILLAAYVFSRTRYYVAGTVTLIMAPIVILALSFVTVTSDAAPTNLFFMAISIVLAALVLSVQGTIVVSILTIGVMLVLTQSGSQENAAFNISVVIFTAMAAGLLVAAAAIRERYLGEINRQLQDRKRAEEETAKRAAELETVAQVSAAATTNLNMDILLQEMVDLTKQRFHLYHAHVYLLDKVTEKLVLAAGAGDAGKLMKEKGHSIPLDKETSLVAQAARSRKGVVANDVTKNPDFLPNALLPNTKSEMAIPMVVGSEMIGVLDVQADAYNRFSDADVQVQTTLASQLAVAVKNARAFEDVQKANLEVERLYDSSIDMIGTAGFDGYFKSLNPAWTNTLGWTIAELTTRPYIEFIHPDDKERTQREADEQLAEGRKTISFENRYMSKDGQYRWLSWNATPDMETGLIYFVTRNITEQKQVQDAISAGEERYRSLTTATAQIVWNTDAQGLVTQDLPYWREYTGQTFDETKGWGWLAAVHPDDQANSGRVWQEALNNKSLYEVEQRIRRYDGVYRDFAARGVPIFNTDGSIREWIGTCTDITESKQSEQARRASQEQLQSIMDNATAVIYLKDVEGRYISINRTYENLFNLKRETTVGKTDHDIFPKEIADSFREIDSRVAETNQVIELEEYAPQADGLHTYISVKFPLRDAEGKPYAVAGISTDITERKQQEIEIRKRAVEMETVAKISSATTTNLDMKTLLQNTVDMAKANFNQYHVQIYLLDAAGENLVLAAGAGEIGAQLVAAGHKIALDRVHSLVAQAARTRDGVIVNDVSQDENFLPNKLLPETKSEMAIPMIFGDSVIGVLDIQSNVMDRFGVVEKQAKLVLASQIASAIQNARAFEDVQRARQEVERLYESSVDMIGTSSFDGYFKSLNPAWTNTLGWTVDELTTKPYIDFVHPDDKERTQREADEQLAAGRKTISFENRYLTRDGKYRWFSWNATPDAQTGLIYFVTRDVTEAKQAAAEIKRSEELIRSIINTIPDWIWMKDRDFRMTLANKALAAEGFGMAEDEIVGKDDYELGVPAYIIEGDAERGIRGWRTDDVEVVEHGQMVYNPYDIVVRRTDNQERIFETTKLPLKDAEDNILGVIGFARDITERNQQDEALRLAREETEVLYQVSTLINEAQDEQAIIDAMVKHALADGIDAISLSIYNNPETPTGSTVAADWRSSGQSFAGAYVQNSDFPVTTSLDRSAMFYSNDLMEDNRIGDAERQSYLSFGVRSILFALLVTGGRKLGVISLSSSQPRVHTEREIRLLRSMAEQATVALERIILTRQTQKRAVEMETVVKVSTDAANTLDIQTLLQDTVDLTKANFNLYHAHIYLLDEANESLILAAGAGEAGAKMVAAGHHIPLNKESSLVAQAARTRKGVIVNDVSQNPDFLPNALLPETKSEMAVPMVVGDKLIGVLDVQGDATNRFGNLERQSQTILASQIAVAIENARSFERTQAALAQTEALYLGSELVNRAANLDELLLSLIESTALNEMDRISILLFDSPWKETRPEVMTVVSSWDRDAGGFIQPGTIYPLHRFPVIGLMNRNKPFVSHDVQADERIDVNARAVLEQIRSRSFVTIPLTSGDEWIGMISAQSHEQRQLNESQIRQIDSLVGQSVAVIQNKLAEETQQMLYAVSTGLTKAHTADGLLEAVVDYAHNNGAISGVLFYIDTDTSGKPEWARIAATWPSDLPGSAVGTNFYLPEFPFAELWTANPHEATFIEDVMTSPVLDETLRGIFSLQGIHGLALLPLYTQGRWIGMYTFSWGKSHVFGAIEREVYGTIGRQATSAVDAVRASEATLEAMQRAETLASESEKRALELETVAVVSAATTTILEVEELLQSVTDLTKTSFDLYHAHVYLLDERAENLVLAAGSGEAGRLMKEKRHSIPVHREHSLVALSARIRDAVIANDVRENPDFLPNVHLPDTLSELAVPLIVGSELMGVMDFQSERIGNFTDDDVRVKNALADQIAVAVKNARAFEYQRSVADRLREVDRLKSEFLANMSHELRTPLNSIIGYSEVLLDGIDGELSDDAVEDVRAIHGSGQHLLNIINDILDLAKIEAGQMRVDRRSLELNTFIKEIIQTAQILVKNKPVELNIVEDPSTPNVYADPIRLRQIVWNLVNNAIKFTEQGSVTVNIGVNDDQQAVIRIVDTGIGMKKDDLPLLFEQFRQVDGSSTRRAGGTGLGLHITRHLVRMHDGDIDVQSEFGIGSTFSFTLPLYAEELVRN